MVSIVMAVHNRRHQLINTLNSIKLYYQAPLEIILVDDTDIKEESIDDIPDMYDFDIHLIKITDKKWVNPCVAYNIGFNKISGTTVVIQNPECLHVGNVLHHVEKNTRSGLYLTYGCYSLDSPINILSTTKDIDFLRKLVVTSKDQRLRGHSGWYNHTAFRPVKYHFCTAISRSDIESLNGFDERYGGGVAHDDCEILIRIENAGIESVIVNDPFVIHQWHQRTNAKRSDPLWDRNFRLYEEKTLMENIVKAPNNTYYQRQ